MHTPPALICASTPWRRHPLLIGADQPTLHSRSPGSPFQLFCVPLSPSLSSSTRAQRPTHILKLPLPGPILVIRSPGTLRFSCPLNLAPLTPYAFRTVRLPRPLTHLDLLCTLHLSLPAHTVYSLRLLLALFRSCFRFAEPVYIPPARYHSTSVISVVRVFVRSGLLCMRTALLLEVTLWTRTRLGICPLIPVSSAPPHLKGTSDQDGLA
ncbi:hypothetical protein B0H13DRAFT_2317916 [Mycena leptocephala]|nr:hypothetical protein B0H13DRAFT_2317916 [Mycena leptocephala]